jgi:L-arabinokinase
LRRLAFYVSGHGFGHASRDVEVVNALGRLAPDARVTIRTAAPRWLFDLTLSSPTELVPVECDTGIVQVDSLHLDAAATIARAAAFHRTLAARAEAEARALSEAGVSLVVGDIPPLAMAAAVRADLPAIALGNFTWDWIYAGYPDEVRAAPDLLPTLRDAYRHATLALRLPMFGGFEVFGARVRDVPFIARRSRFDRAAARRAFVLPEGRPIVLVSFGGYGLASLDLTRLQALDAYTIVLTADPQQMRRGDSPAARPAAGSGNLVTLDEAAIYREGLRYEDLVAASDVVVTKPGYGIIAEAIANHAAVLYTSRGHFVEYDVLVAAMPRYLRCRFIGHDDLFAGRWARHLDALLAQPPPPEHPRTDGAEVVAAIIADYL